MAIKTTKAENINQAIVNKLNSVLSNTDYIDTLKIVIEGSRGEVPSITYCIKEFITPEEGGE